MFFLDKFFKRSYTCLILIIQNWEHGMSRGRTTKMSKKTKYIISGVIVASIVLIGGILYFQQKNQLTENDQKVDYSTVNVKEGTISSTTLLSGTVKALSEEYVYFDHSKGTDATVTVKVGDTVSEGQQLVQYNTTTAQAAYDTAVRNLNKVGRQINHLKTYGVPAAKTEIIPGEGEEGQSSQVTIPPSQQETASYNQQLQDLNDSYADAQAEVNKAQELLNQTVIVSGVSGTVVEVNNDVDPSAKNSQTLVHVASEGQLQVKGTLTEYDLANLKVGQNVKIKSKVYADKEWTGKIAYISNYPMEKSVSTSDTAATGGTSASNYEYKIDITSPIEELKQGFSVSVEVLNEEKHLLVPVSALVQEKDKHYVWVYDDNNSKVTKTEVTIGNADAKSQEILTGLTVGQIVISNPDNELKNGHKVENISSEDLEQKNKNDKKETGENK